MLENISSTSVKLFPAFMTGSSSTDGEDKEFLNLIQYPYRLFFSEADFSLFDTASYAKDITLHFRNETFRDIQKISEEMLEHDIVVKMSPKRRFLIKAKIKKIRKAEPQHIIIPENTYIDT